jgi:transposase-like protein
MKCGFCLMDRVKMVELVAGVCPECGADYQKETAKYERKPSYHCPHCGKDSHDAGGRPVCCHCGKAAPLPKS